MLNSCNKDGLLKRLLVLLEGHMAGKFFFLKRTATAVRYLHKPERPGLQNTVKMDSPSNSNPKRQRGTQI